MTETSELVMKQIDAALKMVRALCSRERDWTMSVPARPDYDPDLVIAGALTSALGQIERLSDARDAALARAEELTRKVFSLEALTDLAASRLRIMQDRAETAERALQDHKRNGVAPTPPSDAPGAPPPEGRIVRAENALRQILASDAPEHVLRAARRGLGIEAPGAMTGTEQRAIRRKYDKGT